MPSSPPAPQAASGRRPINPFLARDPSLRAKRLARALVSDMVAYYPAKHAEGLEKGTLKELFRDEIKKSYEEYVAQVGSDFARSTTHFQESLNEVLGAGRKIF
jgi:L-amino acid N-acyltransferase YncA